MNNIIDIITNKMGSVFKTTPNIANSLFLDFIPFIPKIVPNNVLTINRVTAKNGLIVPKSILQRMGLLQ